MHGVFVIYFRGLAIGYIILQLASNCQRRLLWTGAFHDTPERESTHGVSLNAGTISVWLSVRPVLTARMRLGVRAPSVC